MSILNKHFEVGVSTCAHQIQYNYVYVCVCMYVCMYVWIPGTVCWVYQPRLNQTRIEVKVLTFSSIITNNTIIIILGELAL